MHSKYATIISTAAAVIILAASATASAAPRELDTLGSSNGNEGRSDDLVAEVNSAERNEDGKLLSVTWTIRSEGGESVILSWLNTYSYLYDGPNFSGVTAVSQGSGTRFHPVMDGEQACLCSGEYSEQLVETVGPNESVTYWSLYSVPDDVDAINLEVPGFEPIEDIPID